MAPPQAERGTDRLRQRVLPGQQILVSKLSDGHIPVSLQSSWANGTLPYAFAKYLRRFNI